MIHNKNNINWRTYSLISFIGIILITIISILTKLWILTAIPIGFLFGFFLQKGDLCGSSAFSEVIMMKDRRKIFGIWILITVAMLGFALLDLFGLVKLNPKPFFFLNYIIGGIIFGAGIVLSGGCISGCLYKGATGNLNSIAALLTIPVGVMLVEFGPLHDLHIFLKQYVLKTNDGSVLSLPALFGLPFWVIAIMFGFITFLGIFKFYKRGSSKQIKKYSDESLYQRLMTRPWKPWVAGLAIGLLMIPSYLSSASSGRNYPLGVTHGVMQIELLVIDHGLNHVWKPKVSVDSDKNTGLKDKPEIQKFSGDQKPTGKKVVWWLVALCLSLMLGAWVSGRMSGQVKLLPKPPDEVLIAISGGLLVGTGAAIAGGCVVGNIMSGWALLSVGSFLFGIITMLSNWITTYFYMMGAQYK